MRRKIREQKVDAFTHDEEKSVWKHRIAKSRSFRKNRKDSCGKIDGRKSLNDKEKVDGVESVSLQRGQLSWLTVWSAVSSCRHHRQASCLLSGLCSSLLFHAHVQEHTHTQSYSPSDPAVKRAQLNNESGHIPWRKGGGEGGRWESLRILEGKPKTNLSPFNPSLHGHSGTRQQHQQKYCYSSISCHK